MQTMAIDVCSEIPSTGISPRISFSHDLDQMNDNHDHQRRLDASLLDSTSDFDFGIGGNNVNISNDFLQEFSFSSAGELFANGKIRPVQIKNQPQQPLINPPRQTRNCTHRNNETAGEKKILLKEFLSMSLDPDDSNDQTVQNLNSSSKLLLFWQFRRSNSLNCESTRTKSLIRSLHFLSRSNSTGSAPNQKPPPIAKDTPKQSFQKQPSLLRKSSSLSSSSSSSSSSSGTAYYFYSSTSKPPLLKKSGSYNGNGVRISPVLNIPSPFVSNATGNLFSFCSNFCSGKIKKKKKR